ncbi:MAG: hypothetical protein ACRDQ9_20925, partial [Pseudonocardiaceae bacterium]
MFGGLEGEEQLGQVVDPGLLGQRDPTGVASQGAAGGMSIGEQGWKDEGSRDHLPVSEGGDRMAVRHGKPTRSHWRWPLDDPGTNLPAGITS